MNLFLDRLAIMLCVALICPPSNALVANANESKLASNRGDVEQIASLPGSSQSPEASNRICGERCVAELLHRFFGKSVELVDVIRDLKHNRSEEAMVSLGSLASYLEMRGLATQSIHVEDFNRTLILDKDEDVSLIVHFNPEPNQKFGHFLLWESTGPEREQICWDGLFGIREIDNSEFRQRFSGYALLVAQDQSLLASGVQFSRPNRWMTWVLVLAVSALCGGIFLFFQGK